MKILPVISFLPFLISCSSPKMDMTILSPNENIKVTVFVSDIGEMSYSVKNNDSIVFNNSHLGLILNNGDFSKYMKLLEVSGPALIEDQYELIHGKRKINHYAANEKIFHLENKQGNP